MSSLKGQIYEFGDWRLDPVERLLQRNGVAVPLTPKVFETLLVLVENAGKLVTKDEFMKRVWPDTFVEDLALAQNISQIRKVINGHGPVIETVSKRGYRLTVPVTPALEGNSQKSSVIDLQPQPSPASAEKDQVPTTAPAKSGMRKKVVLIGVTAALLTALILWKVGILQRPFHAEPSGGSEPKILPIISLPGEERMPALSPQGDRVAFFWQAPEANKVGLYVAVVGSQSMVPLTTNGGDAWPAWSADGRYIAFERYAGREVSIFIVPALGGPERLLYSGEHSPWTGPEGLSFSPDGRFLAFGEWTAETQQSAIKLLALNGAGERTITSPPVGFRDAAPTFSPSGDRIAFVRSTGPIFVDEIFVLPVNGGVPAQITFDRHRMYSPPVWTKDGKELLFASNRAGMESLWRIPAAGGTPEPIPGTGPGADHPTLSLSGELAYEYTVQDENVWRMDLRNNASNGTPPRALLWQRTHNLMPQVSPDGKKIAFESGRSGYEEIWVSDADGSDPTQLTHLERYSGSPRWSPDGKYLAFDFRSEQHTAIYVVELAKGVPRPLVASADADNVVPSWSRDGRSIYFASNRGSKDFHIWKVTAQGGGAPLQVTRDSGFMAFESPDGRFIFYSRLELPGIWKVPVDGGPQVRVSPDPQPDDWANWVVAEDGLYFVDSRPGLPPQFVDSKPMFLPEIKFLEFASGTISSVGTMQKPAFFGMTLLPDKTAIIYSQRDRDEHDILMTKLVK